MAPQEALSSPGIQRKGTERGPSTWRNRYHRRMLAVRGSSMEKWFCWGSVGVAGLLLLLFVLDLILSISGMLTAAPFGGLSWTIDVLGAIACGLLLYLAIDAMKDMK
jgi:hypothetical protein